MSIAEMVPESYAEVRRWGIRLFPDLFNGSGNSTQWNPHQAAAIIAVSALRNDIGLDLSRCIEAVRAGLPSIQSHINMRCDSFVIYVYPYYTVVRDQHIPLSLLTGSVAVATVSLVDLYTAEALLAH